MWRKTLFVIYQPYKWLFFFPFVALNTLLFGVLALVFSLMVNQRTGSYIGGALWARVNGLFTPMFVKVTGRHHIRPKTSYVVIPNHQSYWDIFLIYGWIGLDIKWVMKKELRKIPGLGFGSEKVGHIFIDRSNHRKALESLVNAHEKLVNGTSVVIFPEGTRSKTGQLQPFKRGAFKLALDLGLPILPVTVSGTSKILPAGSTFGLMPGCAKLVIHQPIELTDYNEENMNELMYKVSTVINSSLEPQG